MRIIGALVTLLCVLSAVHVSQGNCPWYETDGKPWSSPSTWPSGKVPVAGDDVLIPNATKVRYDVTTTTFFNSITLDVFSQLVLDGTKSLITIDTNYIVVRAGAALRVGSTDCFYTNKVIITLYGPRSNTSVVPYLGNKGIISAGTIAFYGYYPANPWTKITATVPRGQQWFVVKDDITGWNVGDKCVLATTDYYEWMNEVFTITAINGRNVTVDHPAAYLHWGANDEYAEVGLLTRKILIQGDNSSDASLYGGHTLVWGNGTGKVQGVEFTRMGQANVLARYPMHYHFQGDQSNSGSFINGCSFHNNYQRCFTIHGTSGIRADRNVGFNVTGHCYFFEEGSETNNTLTNNLGIYPTPGTMIPTDARPSVFWITNPNNTIINNTGIGGYNGFWYSLPWQPIGMSASVYTKMYPQNTPLGIFDNNAAHSNVQNGLEVDDCLQPDGTTMSPCNYIAMSVPGVSTSTPLRVMFTRMFSWKNRQYGIWMRGLYLTVDNAYLVDNAVGVNLATTANLVQNSVFVGQTANAGMTWMTPGWNDMGRSRPVLFSYDFVIHGYEVYDSGGNQFARNLTFLQFFTDSVRAAGCIGLVQHGYYILPPNNIIAQVNTPDGSNLFSTEINYGNYDAPKHLVINDEDGSWTGDYGGALIGNSALLNWQSNCTVIPAWGNFSACRRNPNGYSQMTILNTNTAATNYGTSWNLTYRATITPLSHPEAAQPIKGIDPRNNYRSQYAGNVYSRWAYLYTFPHPTPPQLEVDMRYASSGEWIVAVFSYPSTTNFTITRGYYKNPVLPGNSLADLNSMTYWFDKVNQFLYIMYVEDNGGLEGTTGFPEYQWGSQYVDITASCGQNCLVTVPQTLPNWVDHDDKYVASLQGCAAGTSSTFQGTAYFSYNNVTKTATYIIYHNIVKPTSAILVGARSGLIFNFTIPGSPIRGDFFLSYTKWNEMWAGDLSITVSNATNSSAIKGSLGCNGVCSPPPLTSSWNPCTQTAPNEMPIYMDNALNSTYGWIDWSWSANRTFNYTGDKRCGSSSVSVIYGSWGAFSMHLNGACAPGQCTDLSWQHPFVNISGYKYLEFWVRSPAGPMPFALTAQAQDSTDKVIGSVILTQKQIDSYIIDNVWTRVRVAFTDMGLKGNELMGTFGLLANANLSPPTWTLLFDNIKLVSDYTDPLTTPPYGGVKSYATYC